MINSAHLQLLNHHTVQGRPHESSRREEDIPRIVEKSITMQWFRDEYVPSQNHNAGTYELRGKLTRNLEY